MGVSRFVLTHLRYRDAKSKDLFAKDTKKNRDNIWQTRQPKVVPAKDTEDDFLCFSEVQRDRVGRLVYSLYCKTTNMTRQTATHLHCLGEMTLLRVACHVHVEQVLGCNMTTTLIMQWCTFTKLYKTIYQFSKSNTDVCVLVHLVYFVMRLVQTGCHVTNLQEPDHQLSFSMAVFNASF